MNLIINKPNNTFYYSNGTPESSDLVIIKDVVAVENMDIYKVNSTQDGIELDIIKYMSQSSNEIKTAIQTHLDDTAKLFKFETGMDRACSYTGYTNPFQTDALILANWRSSIWEYVEAEEAKVILGTRTMPTAVEMLVELEANFPTPVKV